MVFILINKIHSEPGFTSTNFERMMLVDNSSVQAGLEAFHQAGGIKGILNSFNKTRDNTDVFKQYYNDKTQNRIKVKWLAGIEL